MRWIVSTGKGVQLTYSILHTDVKELGQLTFGAGKDIYAYCNPHKTDYILY